MPAHSHKVDLDALFEDGEALRDALLDGDMSEVRFLARRLAYGAKALRLDEVHTAAESLVGLLGAEGATPHPGFGKAVFALSDALDDAQGTPAG
jgi:hypothetical protein